jgi:hypothetical protein
LDSDPRPRLIAWIAALPPLLGTLLLAYVACAEAAGGAPLSDGVALNLAEAAGMARVSEVVRLIEDGHDPSRIEPVRAFILSSTLTQITALEAAVATRRVELVALLDRQGAIHSEDTRAHLACLAVDLEIDDIVEYLAPRGNACRPGAALEAIAQRSAQVGG